MESRYDVLRLVSTLMITVYWDSIEHKFSP